MVGSAPEEVVHGTLRGSEVRKLHVPQRLHRATGRCDLRHRLAALLQPNLILRLRQHSLDAGITNYNFDVRPQRHVTIGEVTAVEKKRMVLAAERRDELIHDSTGHSDKFVLRAA